MQAKAKAKTIRISNRKANEVLRLIRYKKIEEAFAILDLSTRKAAPIAKKVLKSAVANATENHGMMAEDLVVTEALATEGPTIKRYKSRAKGRADRISKRTAHINITVVDDYGKNKLDAAKAAQASKPKKEEVKKEESKDVKETVKPVTEKKETKAKVEKESKPEVKETKVEEKPKPKKQKAKVEKETPVVEKEAKPEVKETKVEEKAPEPVVEEKIIDPVEKEEPKVEEVKEEKVEKVIEEVKEDEPKKEEGN